jgi:hypothetical protein
MTAEVAADNLEVAVKHLDARVTLKRGARVVVPQLACPPCKPVGKAVWSRLLCACMLGETMHCSSRRGEAVELTSSWLPYIEL